MKAIVFDRFGEPAEVLQVRELPSQEPGPGEVRVQMIASPVNPSDLLYIRGDYGRQPHLPASPGFEGVGVVDAVGPGLLARIRRIRVGKRVAVLNNRGGNWQEQVVLPVLQVVPVPPDLPDDQIATFFVNPASALIMTHYVLRVPAGAWVLQTAAASALGKMIIRLGKEFGFRTINVVRRPEQAEELQQAGGDVVISTSHESIEERVQQITSGAGVLFALDAVGGETGSAVARALGRNGRLLVYGTLSGTPLSIDPRLLISGQRRIEGFWLSHWAPQQSKLTMLRLFRKICRYLAAGVLTSQLEASFPLDEVQAAVNRAASPGRKGKILLRMKGDAKQ